MTALVTALSFHQAGRAAEAAALYQQILADEPRNTDALYLYGVLARQAQQPEVAVDVLQRAIALKPGVAQFHNHLGEALLDLGDRHRARAAFMRALKLDARYVDALLNLAALLLENGERWEASMVYAAVALICPGHSVAVTELKRLGRYLV